MPSNRHVMLFAVVLLTTCGVVTPTPTQTVPVAEPRRSPHAAIAVATSAASAATQAADHVALWRPYLASRSTSVGTSSGGHLVDGVELPLEGEHHSIIDRLRKFGARWGTIELVTLIQSAAAYVHRHEGGAPLRVAELSLPQGGDIRSHRSHNSGRDVDLAFYVVDIDTGTSVPAPRQVYFDGRGHSRKTNLRFDVARNWRLVEGLLSQDAATVQWLFVSDQLKDLMLEHARDSGADPALIERAEVVLHQPSAASPHANHFHMRIACSRDDLAQGCVNTGPPRTW